MASKRITLKDVADQSGVSFQTVSRVINGGQDVAADTREKVLAAVEALNYQPGQVARALSRQKTFTIVVAVPIDPDYLFAEPHLLQLIHGIDYEASIRDYNILLSTRRSRDMRPPTYHQLVQRMVVDGVIVDGGLGDSAIVDPGNVGSPIIVTGYTQTKLPFIHPDDEGGAYVMTQHLIALGHRRIGLIGGSSTAFPGLQMRRLGYERAFRDARLTVDPQLYTPGDFTPSSGATGTAQLMEAEEPPTALFALNDNMALGAIRWLREHNYSVPGDVSVAGFDDIANTDLAEPPLTTVHLPSEELGRRAATMLFELINGYPQRSQEVTLPCRLVIRDSTAAIPAG
jgi:DNA-binding LacI/PurR family transcriptional regulator